MYLPESGSCCLSSATALVYTAGEEVVPDWARAADRFEGAADWTHLVEALDHLAAQGTPVPSLRRARAAAQAGDLDAARRALAEPDPGVSPGTIAAWRRALSGTVP